VGSGVYQMNVDADLLMQLVDRAKATVEQDPLRGIELLKDPKGSFVYDDTFVVLADMDGKCVACPENDFAKPGEDLKAKKDASGISVGKRLMYLLEKNEEAWDQCLWNRPGSNQTGMKLIYARRVHSGGANYIATAWAWR
jgi:hypothetical protein